jgi:hypothetical protein
MTISFQGTSRRQLGSTLQVCRHRASDNGDLEDDLDASESKMKAWRLGVVVPAALCTALLPYAGASASPKVSGANSRVVSSTAYLCTVVPEVDRLIVTRRAPDRYFFTFPTIVTVKNAAAARAVAASACALPVAPKSLPTCPAAFFVSYHLVFAVQGEKGMGGEAINLNPTGCDSVTGLGHVRTTAVSTGFYWLLGSAMRIKNPGLPTIEGTLR